MNMRVCVCVCVCSPEKREKWIYKKITYNVLFNDIRMRMYSNGPFIFGWTIRLILSLLHYIIYKSPSH